MKKNLPALTDIWVSDRFVAYFGEQHHKERSYFGLDPDIKTAFNYTKAGWRQLVTTFNRWKWMSNRGIAIAEPEMDNAVTISALTALVMGKAP